MSAPADERVLADAPRLDFDRIRADVEKLVSMERASAAEAKPHVAWLRERLRDAGAHDIRTEPFRFQRRWIWRHGTHVVAGVGAAVAGGPAAAWLTAPRRAELVAPTDAIVARHAGFRALSLVSVDADGTLGPHYHQPTDTPDTVDWHSVEQCTRLAGGIARAWDAAS